MLQEVRQEMYTKGKQNNRVFVIGKLEWIVHFA